MCPYFPSFTFKIVKLSLTKGKTLFQYYLLSRLLQWKQVVLFSIHGDDHLLFYHNKVYIASRNDVSGRNIPRPKSRKFFMWSLLDMRNFEEPRAYMVDSPCFPVQTASPNPIRYRNFLKNNMPILTGLPLWTREELARGYVVQSSYVSFII